MIIGDQNKSSSLHYKSLDWRYVMPLLKNLLLAFIASIIEASGTATVIVVLIQNYVIGPAFPSTPVPLILLTAFIVISVFIGFLHLTLRVFPETEKPYARLRCRTIGHAKTSSRVVPMPIEEIVSASSTLQPYHQPDYSSQEGGLTALMQTRFFCSRCNLDRTDVVAAKNTLVQTS